MRRYFLRPPRPMPQVVVAFFLAACAAPDVSGEIGAFSSAEKAVHEPLKKVLDADLAATRQARINRVIEVGDSVYLPSAMCQAIAGGEAIGAALRSGRCLCHGRGHGTNRFGRTVAGQS